MTLPVCHASSSLKPSEFKVPKANKPESAYESSDKSRLPWREEKISQAMKLYLEKRSVHDKFMREESAQFELGKRHLANIMGEDPETYTQKQIDDAISYLMPSGLFDSFARPHMKHPKMGLPKAKVAMFGLDGRPFNHMFYTGKPNFYNFMFEAGQMLDKLREMDRKRTALGKAPTRKDKLPTLGEWVHLDKVRSMTKERISEAEYHKLITLISRLLYHPYSAHALPAVKRFRIIQGMGGFDREPSPLLIDKKGKPFQLGEGSRKTARAKAFVYGKGTGNVTVNGEGFVRAFPILHDREQIAFPLIFTKLIGDVDVVATVSGGGPSSQAGAIRLAVARALRSFVGPEEREKMRLAGLLNADPRQKERKKPGRHKARKGFTWKKR